MGAAGSIAAENEKLKTRNYFIMKAYNLRPKGTTVVQQFYFLKEESNNIEKPYICCTKLREYMKLPDNRFHSFLSCFNAEENQKVNFDDFIRFLEGDSKVPEAENKIPPLQNPVDEVQPDCSNSQLSESIVAYSPEPTSTSIVPPAPVAGLWKKREITIQERITEYTKIDENGVPQNLIESEKQQIEIIHMESEKGEFAHREITHFEQTEKLNEEVVHHETGKEEFLHLKSEHDEFSHFESSMPEKTEECEAGPPSPSIKPNANNNDEDSYNFQEKYNCMEDLDENQQEELQHQ